MLMDQPTQQIPTPSQTTPPPANGQSSQSSKQSSVIKTLVVVFFLLFLYPVGVILVFTWTNWSTNTKIIAALIPFISAFILGIIAAILVAMIDPFTQLKKANLLNCQNQCNTKTTNACVTTCLEKYQAPQQ